MKITLSIITVFTVFFFSYSQELKTDEVDEFTGSVIKRTESIAFHRTFSETGVLSVSRIDSSFFISILLNPKIGCSGSVDNYVIFLFEDGTKYQLEKDISEVECSGFPSSFYEIDPDAFKGKTIQKIRIRMSDGLIDREWDEKGKAKYTVEQLIEATR